MGQVNYMTLLKLQVLIGHTNAGTDPYTSGMQQGFYNKMQANPAFQKEFDATFGGNHYANKEISCNDFMASNFLPYEIQAMYK